MVKKEKVVKQYTRKSKSGKTVVVRQHTAKYDAAEALKEAAKKKGAGDELEKLKRASKVKDLINDPKSPWFEFENNFEEGWGGDSSVFCLANNAHHREVANLAANELAKKYNGESFFQKKGWESIAQKAYNDAAKKLYPKEKLWSGDNEDNPAFWHEHLTAGGSKKSAIKQLWRKEWGSFEDFGKKGRTTSKELSRKRMFDINNIKNGVLRASIAKEVEAITDGEYSEKPYTWNDVLKAARNPAEKSVHAYLERIGIGVPGVTKKSSLTKKTKTKKKSTSSGGLD